VSELVALVVLFGGEISVAERELLSRYELTRGVELGPPTREAMRPPGPYPSYDAALVERLEAELDEARTLGSSLDEQGALALLDRVEGELLLHPELPQAAFLLAERHRVAASVRARSPDGSADVEALERAARVLEGSRAASFGEALQSASGDDVRVRVRVNGLDARDRLEIDGVVGPHERAVAEGRHHVRVLRGDELAHAAFVEVTPARSELDLGLSPIVACSADDLRGVTGERGFIPSAPAGIVCRHWVVVRRSPRGLELAECTLDRCRSFQVLRAPITPKQSATPAPERFPTWATVALAGLGAVGTGSLILWSAGVFDRSEPAPVTRFVYEGPPRP
jgi:hypothetical protein